MTISREITNAINYMYCNYSSTEREEKLNNPNSKDKFLVMIYLAYLNSKKENPLNHKELFEQYFWGKLENNWRLHYKLNSKCLDSIQSAIKQISSEDLSVENVIDSLNPLLDHFYLVEFSNIDFYDDDETVRKNFSFIASNKFTANKKVTLEDLRSIYFYK